MRSGFGARLGRAPAAMGDVIARSFRSRRRCGRTLPSSTHVRNHQIPCMFGAIKAVPLRDAELRKDTAACCLWIVKNPPVAHSTAPPQEGGGVPQDAATFRTMTESKRTNGDSPPVQSGAVRLRRAAPTRPARKP